jgi:hypothetical protein
LDGIRTASLLPLAAKFVSEYGPEATQKRAVFDRSRNRR